MDVVELLLLVNINDMSFQCFDTVDWVTGRYLTCNNCALATPQTFFFGRPRDLVMTNTDINSSSNSSSSSS